MQYQLEVISTLSILRKCKAFVSNSIVVYDILYNFKTEFELRYNVNFG